MTEDKPRAVRPDYVEADPRTDGIADQGELPPLSEEEIAAGVEHDWAHRERTIADPATPFAEDPAEDQYGEPLR